MVVQKTIDNLKERPKDEKTAVAGGIAVVVVAVLLFAWGLWFVSNLKRGGEFNTFVGGKQDIFMNDAIRGAQKLLQDNNQPASEQMRELRDASVEVTPVEAPVDTGDAFNIPSDVNQ